MKSFLVLALIFSSSHGRLSDLDMHPHVNRLSKISAKAITAASNSDEHTKEFWLTNAKNLVREKLNERPNTNRAKNVILFLGDGMGHTTIAASRVAMGGEEKKLSFESFPYTASSRTYCVDKGVADSACSANAFLHGVKSNYGTIGLNGFAERSNCADSVNPRLRTQSIAHWAQEAALATGFVTTTRITHATPAGLYANSAERDWENNAEIIKSSCDHHQIDDIAEQLVFGGIVSKFNVIFGGGMKNFINSTESEHDGMGARTDGRNLIKEWMAAKSSRTFLKSKSEMSSVSVKGAEQILGIFSNDHMPYHLDVVDKNIQEIPSLTDMTLKAIEILEKNENGFFLFVEGGRIDHAHHDTMAKYALDETIEFSKAVEATLEKINLKETLVVVTSDHSHTMTYAGYASRNHDIFGYQGNADDKMPYFTLSYANGNSHNLHFTNGHRVDPKSFNLSPLNLKFPATIPLKSETHSGEDVGIWAIGASSYLFRGSMEQNLIAHILAYAACIGDGLKACDK